MFWIVSIFNFLVIVLWPCMWSVLENFPCVLEKNLHSGATGWNVRTCLLSLKPTLLSKAAVSFLVFSLDVKSTMSLTINALLSLSPFRSANVWFLYLVLRCLVHIVAITSYLWNWHFITLYWHSFTVTNSFCLKIYYLMKIQPLFWLPFPWKEV